MAVEFRSKELRDLYERHLSDLAKAMVHSRDQGHDGRIAVTDDMIADVRVAAYIVGMTPIRKADEQSKEKTP